MQVFLSAPQINVDHVDSFGYDIGLGRYFSSRSERKFYLKENNLVDIGDSSVYKKAKERLDADTARQKQTGSV